MKGDSRKTKAQLLDEIEHLRERVRAQEENCDCIFSDALLSIVGALVIVIDTNGRIMQFNHACEKLTGYTAEEVHGRCFWEFLLLPEDVDKVKEVFGKLCQGMFPGTHENYWVTKDGTLCWISWASTCLLDDDEEVERVIGTGIDLSHHRELETELRTARDELEAKVGERTSELSRTIAQLQEEIGERKRTEEKARYFSSVLENSLNEIYIFDGETLNFVEVNRGARENLGYTMEELRKLTPIDFKPEFTAEAFQALAEPLRTGEREKIEFTTVHQRKDGTRYPVEVHLQLMTAPKPLFVAIILDITERKRIEDALRESEERHRVVLDTMTEAVIIVEAGGKVLFVNGGFCDLYGYTREEIVGMSTMELIHPDYHYLFHDFVKQVAATGHFSGETIDIRKDGTRFNTEALGAGIRFGGEDCLVAVIRDVTERKEAQKALEEHALKLDRLRRRMEVRNAELQRALDEIATLRGILPICSFCKKVRDDEGYWQQVDTYISDHTGAEISHGVCPECLKKHYPNLG